MSKVIESIRNIPVPDVVQDSSVEDLLKTRAIGEKIRKQRLMRSMGLVELGKLTGLSASFLSQLETGRVCPTLRNLARLCSVFECDLSYFFQVRKADPFQISRSKERFRLMLNAHRSPVAIVEDMSTLISDGRLAPVITELLAGSDPTILEPELYSGQEFIYLIGGSIKITTDQNVQTLTCGDVGWLDGNAMRQYRCVGFTSAKVLIIAMPYRTAESSSLKRPLFPSPKAPALLQPTAA